MAYRRLPLAEGFVEYVVDAPDDARGLLVFHVGSPSAAIRTRCVSPSAAEPSI